MATQPRTLSARKLDTVYFVFFLIHIPIMLCESLCSYYYGAAALATVAF